MSGRGCGCWCSCDEVVARELVGMKRAADMLSVLYRDV